VGIQARIDFEFRISNLPPIPRVEPQRHRGTEKTQSHPHRKHEDTKRHPPTGQPRRLPHKGQNASRLFCGAAVPAARSCLALD